MNISDYLKYATDFLTDKDIDTARLDSLVLMEYALSMDKARILSSATTELTSNQVNVLNKLLAKRANHLPISYITHNKEFYGRDFFINKYVLEPRPESETMIDELKLLLSVTRSSAYLRAADIGTGSGALGITAMLEVPNLAVDLIDIDKEAVSVAKRNVVLHTLSMSVIQANLLGNNDTEYDVLLCNLPYIPDGFHINLAATHEPKIAIFGGKDGLDVYRKLFKLVKKRQHKPLYILTEALPPQHTKLKEIATASGYDLKQINDFICVFQSN